MSWAGISCVEAADGGRLLRIIAAALIGIGFGSVASLTVILPASAVERLSEWVVQIVDNGPRVEVVVDEEIGGIRTVFSRAYADLQIIPTWAVFR